MNITSNKSQGDMTIYIISKSLERIRNFIYYQVYYDNEGIDSFLYLDYVNVSSRLVQSILLSTLLRTNKMFNKPIFN